jgi:hypothetical protein
MAVIEDREPVGLRDLSLNGLDGVVLELDDQAALHADEVIVVPTAERVFITGGTVPEVSLLGQPTFAEDAQRTVDGCESDPGIHLLHLLVQLFGGDMAARLKEDLRSIALRGLEPARKDNGAEPSSSIRDGPLFVLALAAHGGSPTALGEIKPPPECGSIVKGSRIIPLPCNAPGAPALNNPKKRDFHLPAPTTGQN